MAASGTLASQYVEFVTKGLDELQQGLDSVKGQLGLVDDAGKSLGEHIVGTFSGMANRLKSVQGEVIALDAAFKTGGIDDFHDALSKALDEQRVMTFSGKVFDAMQAMKDGADAAEVKLAALEKMIGSGEYDALAKRMQDAAAATQAITFDSRVNDATQQFANNLDAAKVQLEALKKAASSGELAKYRVEMERIAAETKRIQTGQSVFASWATYAVGKVKEVGGAIAANLQGAWAKASSGMQGAVVNAVAIGAAVVAFQQLTNAAKSWVQAGLSGTAHGNALSMQMTMLSQQIAGVFVPTIEKVIRGLERVVSWFRSLTGEQQGNIRRWVEAAAAMVLVHTILGRLIVGVISFVGTLVGGMVMAAGSIFTTLIPAITALVSAIVAGSGIATTALGLASAGISVLLGLAAAVVSAFVSLGLAAATVGTGIAVGTHSGRAAFASLIDAIKPIIAQVVALGKRLWDAIEPTLERLGGRFGGILTSVGAVLTRLVAAAVPVLERFGAMIAEVGSRIDSMLAGLNFGTLESMGRQLIDLFDSLLPTIRTVLLATVAVVGWIVRAVAAVTNFVQEWVSLKTALIAIVSLVGVVAAALGVGLALILAPLAVAAAAIAVILAPLIVGVTVLGAVLAGVGYVIYKIAEAVWPVVKGLWECVKAAWEIGVAIFEVLKPILMIGAAILFLANPVGMVIAAFAAVGYVIYRIWQAFEPVRTAVMKIVGAVFMVFAAVGRVIASMIGLQGTGFSLWDIFSKIGEVFEGWMTFLARFAELVAGTLITVMSQLLDLIEQIATTMADALGNLPEAMQRQMGITSDAMRRFAADIRAARASLTAATAGPNVGARPNRPNEGRNDVQPVGGSFETAIDLYRRLQESAVKNTDAGRMADAAETTAGNTTAAAELLREILQRLGVIQPGQPIIPPGSAPDRARNLLSSFFGVNLGGG